MEIHVLFARGNLPTTAVTQDTGHQMKKNGNYVSTDTTQFSVGETKVLWIF